MPNLVLPTQSSFIKGRNITDNIIAQEVIHSMAKKQGQKGWLAIKVDIEKAFDNLSCNFIQDTLPRPIIRLIMHFIISPQIQILWNGIPTQPFIPYRGICQGDPLSPNIFVLCTERLS